jgi:hypothetical protein
MPGIYLYLQKSATDPREREREREEDQIGMKVLKWTQYQDQADMFKKSFLTQTKCLHRL